MKFYTSLLCVLLLSGIACRPVKKQDSEPSFAGGEHMTLGDDAYKNACAKSKVCPDKLSRADGKVDFSYGQLVAFSGDFYAQPDDLYSEVTNKDIWHPFANSVTSAKSLFDNERDFIKATMGSGKIQAYPDYNLRFVFAYPGYLDLASNNIDHFGWHAIKAYVKYHQQAIDLALEARKGGKVAGSLLQKAIFYNAFADHFLSDSFAAGHLRNPRAQTMRWQKETKQPSQATQALSKLIHDFDHHIDSATAVGLKVRNARGDNWETRGDGDLFSISRLTDKHITLPIEAIQISLQDVLNAFATGDVPETVFPAIELTPFVSPDEKTLASLFPADMPAEKIKTLLQSLGVLSYFNILTGLNEPLTRKFFTQLPILMEEFRKDVSKEAADPILAKRLPPAFIEGFKNVH